MITLGTLHAADDRPRNLQRGLAKPGLYTVGSIVPGTTLDRFDLGIRNQFEDRFGLQPDILDPQMAGHLVSDLAE